jgi:photosystem II stability/assembly factor-like uncharacterized protein
MPTQVNARVVALVVGIVLPVLTVRQSAAQAHGEDVPEELQRPFTRAMFTNANTGYVYHVGDRTVTIATADGGATWRLAMDTLASRPDKASTGIFFLDLNTFWILHRDCTIQKTTDGGRTFLDLTARALDPLGHPVLDRHGHPRRLTCGGLFFRNRDLGWVACGDMVLRTSDGGESWQWTALPAGVSAAFDPWFFGDQEGMAVGHGVVRTTDGGQTWQAVSGAPTRLDELSCTQSGFCVAGMTAYGPLFASSDHGRTWTDLKVPLKPDQQDELLGFQAVSANFAVAVGRDNGERIEDFDQRIAAGGAHPPVRGLILKWDGMTWTRITHDAPRDLAGVFFVDANNGWFPDFENTIYKTTDGGQTLQFVPDYFRQIAALTPSPAPFVLPTPSP